MTDYSIVLSKVPNQSFSTTVNGHLFEFEFRTFRSIMYANVSIDGLLVQAGARCIPDTSLFGGEVNALASGVFMFLCIDGNYPSFEDFDGTTCRFVYIPRMET